MDAFAQPFAHRAQLLAALPGAIQAAEEHAEATAGADSASIFDLMEADGEANGERRPPGGAAAADVPRWSNTEKLKDEKEALDFYFSSHPLAEHDAALEATSPRTPARW